MRYSWADVRLPVLNHAHAVAFVATGASKQDILAKVLDEPQLGPMLARQARGVSARLHSLRTPLANFRPGRVYWFVDNAAAAETKFPVSEYSL